MSSASDTPHVSSLDEKPLTAYRGVSVAAVLALALGLACSLALAHPFLWVLPPVTIAIALIALRAIHAEDSTVTGHWLAVIGLLLALIFGLWAPARVISRQAHLYRQGRQFADQWLELVRAGKLYDAHQLTLPHNERQRPGVVLEKVYSDSAEAHRNFDTFVTAKPMKTLAAVKDSATYTFVAGDGVPPREYTTEHVALRYTMRYTENGREREMPLRLVLDRDESERGRFYWRIRGISDPNRDSP